MANEYNVAHPTKTDAATCLEHTLDEVTNYPVGTKMTVIDLSGDAATTVEAGPAILVGFSIDVALSAHAVTISDGATVRRTIPASSPVGDRDCFNAIFNTSIVVTPNASSTGTLVLYTRAF